jgi:hypothetical protein
VNAKRKIQGAKRESFKLEVLGFSLLSMIADTSQPGFLGRLENYCRMLCEARWQDPSGPLRLNRGLSSGDLQKAGFFHNTRQFLLALQEQEGTAATATENLNRVFVRHMLDRLALSPVQRQNILEMNKVINEQDLWVLHLSRLVSEISGLIARRSKLFKLTRQGAALLTEDRAGDLYHTLFIAYFRKFDLRYDFNLRDVPGIQQSMAAILWRLGDVLEDWRPVRGLTPQVLLPRVLQQLHEAMVSQYDQEEWILSGYVLRPLQDFGLIESRSKSDWPGVTEKDSIRLTPLWKKFISFSPFAG